MLMCHMVADTLEELHVMANEIGMKRAAFQDAPKASHPHYDVSQERRALALELGAVYDATREVLGEEALFLHTSDHGAQWPFGKWNLYDDGIRTPLIVSWPGQVAAASRSDAMVSWIDILPTLVEAAGGKPPAGIDGRSFLPVLKGVTTNHREVIFATHSGDGSMDVYPSRAVATPDGWKYIRNLHPEYRFTSHIMRQRHDGHRDRRQAGDP